MPLRQAVAALSGIVGLIFAEAAFVPALADGRAGDFDFYVLSLTWTPGYCATDDNPDPAQCSGGRGFLVHGLWPEYEVGYPDYCASSFSRDLNPTVLGSLEGIMPSSGLARYEWRRHGLCSGLAADDYFALMRAAWKKVTIPAVFRTGDAPSRMTPASVEAAFLAANPALSADAMAVQCTAGKLTEVRICLTKDLTFRRCLDVDDGGCRSASISVPPTH